MHNLQVVLKLEEYQELKEYAIAAGTTPETLAYRAIKKEFLTKWPAEEHEAIEVTDCKGAAERAEAAGGYAEYTH